MEDIMKKIKEDEERKKERAFLEDAAEVRSRIELLAGYGFDTSQAIQLLICMGLDRLGDVLTDCDGYDTVGDSLSKISSLLEDCMTERSDGKGVIEVAVTGTVETYTY